MIIINIKLLHWKWSALSKEIKRKCTRILNALELGLSGYK